MLGVMRVLGEIMHDAAACNIVIEQNTDEMFEQNKYGFVPGAKQGCRQT